MFFHCWPPSNKYCLWGPWGKNTEVVYHSLLQWTTFCQRNTWVQSQKQHFQFPVHFQGKPFNITVIQVYAPTTNTEEAETEWFYEDLQDLLELIPQKDVLFITGDWNAKVGSQEIPGVTGKFGLRVQNEAGQKLTHVCWDNTLVIAHSLSTTQEATLHMDITRWSILKSDQVYSSQPKMEKLYTISKKKSWSWVWLRSLAPYCKIQA